MTVVVGGSAAVWTASSIHTRLDEMDQHITERATETERLLGLRIDAQRETADRRIADTDRRIDRVEGRVWPMVVPHPSSPDAGVVVTHSVIVRRRYDVVTPEQSALWRLQANQSHSPLMIRLDAGLSPP